MAWKKRHTGGAIRDNQQLITDKIISAIEAGVDNYSCPWMTLGKHGRPHNVVTGKKYTGINTIVLWGAALEYSTNAWGTYKQWASLTNNNRRVSVRKGEHGTLGVLYKTVGKDDPAQPPRPDGQPNSHYRLMRFFPLFNADQVDGYDPPVIKTPSLAQRLTDAETYFANTDITVRHGGDSAFYVPSLDLIQMPDPDRFKGANEDEATEQYYRIRAHETGHATGHASRLDRGLDSRFGQPEYAYEELVAELFSAFVLADLGISMTPLDTHAQYVANWLAALKGDKSFIFTAAAAAQRALDWCDKKQGLAAEDDLHENEEALEGV